MKFILTILCLVLQCYALIAQVPLPLKQFIQNPKMKGASVALVVKEVDGGKTLYSYEGERLLTPASVMKTVTTATALSLLGPDYTYPTTLAYDGEITAEGILKGNLYIEGSGDPSLGSSHLEAEPEAFLQTWVTAIQEAGIHQIEGSVIADEQIFDEEGLSMKWVYEDLGSYYAAGCYGLSVFDNIYRLSIRTGAAGTTPTLLETTPEIPDLQFINRLKTISASSDSAYIVGAPFVNKRYLQGSVPTNRNPYQLKGDIPDPPCFLATYLTNQLEQAGIQVEGTPSSYRIEQEAGRWRQSTRKEIITTYSPTLYELVKICNQKSHNLYADAFLKTIGLQDPVRPTEILSSFGRGVRVLKQYWQSQGMDTSGLLLYDGSGLAPTDKLSAEWLCNLLIYMATQSEVSAAYQATFPRCGIEGSVRNFLKGSALQGKARLKSGSMSGVRCYAGYIEHGGKQYVLTFLLNNYTGTSSQATRAIEQLLLGLFAKE